MPSESQKAVNGYIGKMISEYLKSRIPDAAPLVYATESRRNAYDWRLAIPDLTNPGRLVHGKYTPGQNQLIKEFCDGVLITAGYNPEINRETISC